MKVVSVVVSEGGGVQWGKTLGREGLNIIVHSSLLN